MALARSAALARFSIRHGGWRRGAGPTVVRNVGLALPLQVGAGFRIGHGLGILVRSPPTRRSSGSWAHPPPPASQRAPRSTRRCTAYGGLGSKAASWRSERPMKCNETLPRSDPYTRRLDELVVRRAAATGTLR